MATRKFIRTLCLFLLPPVVFLGCIEYILSLSENSYTRKHRLMEESAPSAEVLIAGTSHTLCAINPAFLSRKAISIAESSQPLYYDSSIICKYLPGMTKLRLVILPIDYFTMYYILRPPYKKAFYYKKFWGIGNPVIPVFDPEQYSSILFYRPRLATDILTADIAAGSMRACFGCQNLDPNGFFRLQGKSHRGDFERQSHFIVQDWNRTCQSEDGFQRNSQMLDQLLSVLDQKNIRVLLLSSPMDAALRTQFDTTKIRRSQKFIGEMLSKHRNCRYTDYSADPRVIHADFYDPNHLNTTGAEKFSHIIDRQIDSMLAR